MDGVAGAAAPVRPASGVSLPPSRTPPSGPPGRSNARKRPTLKGCRARRENTSCASAGAAHESPRLRRPPLSEAAVDERVETFLTPRDWLRYAVGRFLSAGLAFGHGATTALDEAAFLILEGLGLPIDTLDPFLDARLLRHERMRLLRTDRGARDDPQARRLPCQPRLHPGRAVLCRRARHRPAQPDRRTGDDRFRRGQRARSAIRRRIASVLDLCTGGGSLAILAARVFPNARIEAVDVSPGALEVAARNLEEHGLAGSHRAEAGRSVRPAQGRALRLDPDEPALCRRGGDRGLSARICGGADARACRRSGRARHRAPDPERGAGAFDGRAGRSSARSAARAGSSRRNSRICRSSGSTPRTRRAKCSFCAPPISARRRPRARGKR